MIQEIAANPVSYTTPFASTLFSSKGISIDDFAGLLKAASSNAAPLKNVSLAKGGVQIASTGAIQDPAGSAVGFSGKPVDNNAGGASGAIYSAFPDLEPIPAIAPRSAIFNTSTGPGHRVVHTYSPQLQGSPTDASARTQALADLANSYCNAIIAFNDRGLNPKTDGALLNLVPIAAAIFAGNFRDPVFTASHGHLHPSYTLAAICIAVAALDAAKVPVPPMTLYYYDAAVLAVAKQIINAN